MMKRKTHLKTRIFALLGCIAILAVAMAVPISATVLVADSNINFFNLGAFTSGERYSFDDDEIHYHIVTIQKYGALRIYAWDAATEYFRSNDTIIFRLPISISDIIPQVEADQYYYSGYSYGGNYSISVGFMSYGDDNFKWEFGTNDPVIFDEDEIYSLKNDDYNFAVKVTTDEGWKYTEEDFINFSCYIEFLQITQNYNIHEIGIEDSFKIYNEAAFDIFNDVYESAYNNGYENGYSEGTEEGYSNGYDTGYWDGREFSGSEGYDEGYETGYDEGYSFGYEYGYWLGETAGYETGEQVGYNAGKTDGYNTGYAAGEAAGEKSGYTTGYQEGYTAGSSANTEDAYNEGFQDAVDIYNGAELNIFEDCTLTVYIGTPKAYVMNEVTYAPFTYSSTGVSLASAYDYAINQMQSRYSDFDATTVDGVTYIFSFNGQFIYSNGTIIANMPIGIDTKMFAMAYGEYDSGAAAYYDLAAKAIGANGYQLKLTDTNAPDPSKLLVQKIEITFEADNKQYLTYAKNLTLKTDAKFTNNSYRTGYLNGYSNGYDEGVVQAQDLAYNEGYDTGFTSGKQEGLQLSSKGTWRELMLAVTEAPINTFQSLFNFEILGLDMKAAFGSLLTVCVILIIVKKVIL